MTKCDLPWTYRVGWFLVITGIMIAIPVFVLPSFEQSRGVAFWMVILPLASIGVAMIAYQHHRGGGAAR